MYATNSIAKPFLQETRTRISPRNKPEQRVPRKGSSSLVCFQKHMNVIEQNKNPPTQMLRVKKKKRKKGEKRVRRKDREKNPSN
jgi:hypothetical protein